MAMGGAPEAVTAKYFSNLLRRPIFSDIIEGFALQKA